MFALTKCYGSVMLLIFLYKPSEIQDLKVFFASYIIYLKSMRWPCSLYIILFFTFCNVADAQRDRSFEIGAGGIFFHSSSVNNRYSQLPFSGTGGGAMFWVAYHKGNTTDGLLIHYARGKLANTLSETVAIDRRYATAEYTHAYRLDATENARVQIQAGGGLDLLYVENAFSGLTNMDNPLDFAASIAVITSIRYVPIEAWPGFCLMDMINFPLLSAVGQAGYSTEGPVHNKIAISAVGSFTRMINTLKACAQTGTLGKFSISYRFDYYRQRPAIRQVFHGLEAAYTITL
jgi:hypothetical protein